jgi:phosphoribosylformimino-5-aminoimidazole carboxamide ribotide isomerase
VISYSLRNPAIAVIKNNNVNIVPAIDLIEGKCVRLTEGDYSTKKIYNEDPLEVALRFSDAGLIRLHLVDLDGAKAGVTRNLGVLEKLATKTSLVIDFSGGIKTDIQLRDVFNAGAAMAGIGSVAVKEEALFLSWMETFGSEKIMLGADVRKGKIAVSGWLEQTDLEIIAFLKEKVSQGVKKVFVTDISKDGMLAGPALDLYRHIMEEVQGISLIASGGVSSVNDLEQLAGLGLSEAIVGKALYENRISLPELQRFITTYNPS